MALFRFSSGDIAGFKVMFSLAVMYGLTAWLVYSVLHMKFITPLGLDAPLDRFSEARALQHLRVLVEDNGGRQEGRPGLREAAEYIKMQLATIKEKAGPNIRIEVEETSVNGSFNMIFIGRSIALAYRNHTNVLMRISSINSQDGEPSVLVNGHFDSAPGSPGAGDCGSCVASMLELARLCVDSGWTPPRPVVFLFNGAEELFMLGSHGFATTHRWRDSIGAFINIEASGTGGTDLLCQSGPVAWPSYVYAQSALHPMANSAAQDVFGTIPGDTDYRMFAKDYGDVPGLDIIFLLGGYYYHTSSDTVERLLPGSIQARGDNLFSLVEAFASSSMLQNAHERESLRNMTEGSDDYDRAVFFDYFSLFLVYYSRRISVILHSIPVFIYFIMPLFLHFPKRIFSCSFPTFCDFFKGTLYHALGVILGVIFPVIFAILRLLCSRQSMNWFSQPYLAFLMFIPCSLLGLLTPRYLWRSISLSQNVKSSNSSKEELADEAIFYGAFGLYSLMTLAYLLSGLSGGFLTFLLAVFMLPAWFFYQLSVRSFGRESLRSTASYVIPLIPCLMYSTYFGGFLATFLIEKMGMAGSHPPPIGYFVQDVIVAATVGFVTGWCIGPLLPVVSRSLARSSVMQFLLHGSLLALAVSSQFFPYSTDAPKRVVFQQSFRTTGAGHILDSSYDFAVVDSNSLLFVFQNAPEVATALHIGSDLSYGTYNQPLKQTWLGIYPISSLFTGSLKFPADGDNIYKHYQNFPSLTTYKPDATYDGGSRRIYLEFSLGSLKEVWVSVLNITGPLSNWSFSDNILPAPETVDHGPPSYILRLSGASQESWNFWLEARNSEPLRVDVAVMDQHLTEAAMNLKDLFPKWMDVTSYSSFMSSYVF